MPKEVFVINEFHGGKDSKTDQRDIASESSVEQVNIETSENLASDRRGKVKISGNFQSSEILIESDQSESLQVNTDDWPSNIYNSGGVVFNVDYSFFNDSGDIAEADEMEYTKPSLFPIVYGRDLWIYDSGKDIINIAIYDIDGDDESIPIDPTYYIAQGGLYLCDKNLQNNTPSQMIKVIRNTFFKGFDYEYTVNELYIGDSIVGTPTEGRLTLNGDIPEDPLQVNINIDFDNPPELEPEQTLSSEFKDDITFGISYFYYKSAPYDTESDIYFDDTTIVDWTSIDTSNPPRMSISCNISEDQPWPSHIAGFRIYFQKAATTDWWLLSEFDFLKGTWYLPSHSEYYQDLSNAEGLKLNSLYNGSYPYLLRMPIESYEFMAKRAALENINATFKTACVMQQRAYIGNVKVDGVVYGDRILKSAHRRYSIFPEESFIDVALDDGDEIIKLESFADRLLQFKRFTLFIINIPLEGGGAFLEAQYPGYGVSNPSAVSTYPGGILFANTEGFFRYDSENISNILVSGDVFKLSSDEWKDFSILSLDGEEYPRVLRVGYDPEDESALVYNELNIGYKVNMLNGAINKLLDKTEYNLVTNMFRNNDKLQFLHIDSNNQEPTNVFEIKSWKSNPVACPIELITKDITFGQPSVKKKIYKIWVTYKADYTTSSQTGIKIYYAVNGSEDWSLSYDSYDGTYLKNDGDSHGLFMGTAGVWKQAYAEPTSSSVKNIYSFQIKITSDNSSTIDRSFEIDDISIVYRRKRVK